MVTYHSCNSRSHQCRVPPEWNKLYFQVSMDVEIYTHCKKFHRKKLLTANLPPSMSSLGHSKSRQVSGSHSAGPATRARRTTARSFILTALRLVSLFRLVQLSSWSVWFLMTVMAASTIYTFSPYHTCVTFKEVLTNVTLYGARCDFWKFSSFLCYMPFLRNFQWRISFSNCIGDIWIWFTKNFFWNLHPGCWQIKSIPKNNNNRR